MPYAIANKHDQILFREAPSAPLGWMDRALAAALDWRYAVLFDTEFGADKCAKMQGGTPIKVDAGGYW